jgi:hypothetical protein
MNSDVDKHTFHIDLEELDLPMMLKQILRYFFHCLCYKESW